MNEHRSTSVRGFFNQLHEALHGRNALRLRVTENRPAIHQHLKLVVLMAHRRADGVSRFDLSLQAPGQASQAASKQASANFDVGVGVHGYFFSITSTLAMVSAQSSFNTAELVPVWSKPMVNCSVGDAFFETFISTRARSCFSSYCVPH